MLILFPLVVAMTPLALWITFNAHILYLVKLRVHCVLQRVRVVFMCLFCSQKWAVQRLALRGSYLKALGMCFQSDCISRCLMFPCPGSLSPSPSFPFHPTNVDIAFSFGSTKTLGRIHFCPTCSSLSEKVYRAWSTLGRIPKNNIIIIKKMTAQKGSLCPWVAVSAARSKLGRLSFTYLMVLLALSHMSFTNPGITFAKCKPHKGSLLHSVLTCSKFLRDDVLCKHSCRLPSPASCLGARWWR